METKRLGLEALELKMDGGEMAFGGYASVFGGVDSYGDTIDPKAYNKTLKRKKGDRPIRMRWNHYGPVIGKWDEMRVDDKGLWVEGKLTPGHSVAADVYASLKFGAVDGMSIGFIDRASTEQDGGGRLLKEIDLIEISVVEEPADPGAKIGDVKSLIDAAESLKELESLLRESGGFSRTDATWLVKRIKSLAHGEREPEPAAPTGELDEAISLIALHTRHSFKR